MQNARHIDTFRAGDKKGGGNYSTLKEYLDRRRIKYKPFSETAVTVASTQVKLLDDTLVSGNIAVGGDTAEETTGGLVAAALGGGVGAAITTSITDDVGEVANLVYLRDASTHDPVTSATGRRIYGLLQCASTVADGDPVGASGSENLQVSFVEVGADSSFTLVSIDGDFELRVPVLYAERHTDDYLVEGGAASGSGGEVIDPTQEQTEPLCRYFSVSTQFPANDPLNISTGNGVTGVSSPYGDTISGIRSTEAAFDGDSRIQVYLNGIYQEKEVDVIWVTSLTMKFPVIIDPGDKITLIVPKNY
ncbi:MAG: hypothetical protein GWN00_01325 [Aliifodinibius sp.]|nr:hypothetical protein [Fodinibius sp.]NIV09973.1 hypothetical protein [Fodinibius sp.]NIY23503.1 hypothetical protein [Fodinibius sp.]